MTHEWMLNKQKEREEYFKNYPQVLVDKWEWIPKEYRDIHDMITDRRIVDLIDKIKNSINTGDPVDEDVIYWLYQKTEYSWLILYFKGCEDKIEKASSYYDALNTMALRYWSFLTGHNDRFADLEDRVMDFDGDVIITDPCYFSSNHDFDCTDIAAYGIKGIESSTMYGDWSCTTYDKLTCDENGRSKPIGEFCADSGMVCVCDLQSVLKFNPKYDKASWTRTIIKDFKGTIRIKIDENEPNQFPEFIVSVVGKGTDKKTGKPIEFFTQQTGL